MTEPLVHYRRGGASGGAAASDGATFLSRTRARQQREQAEIEQMLHDAESTADQPSVRGALEVSMARVELLGQLLGAPDQQSLRAVLNASKVLPLSWCLRQYLYLRWPELGAAATRNKENRSATWRAIKARARRSAD